MTAELIVEDRREAGSARGWMRAANRFAATAVNSVSNHGRRRRHTRTLPLTHVQ